MFGALQLDCGLVQLGDVFDNGKAKPCTAGRPGVALVDPVKAFKYSGLMFFWNADAGIFYTEHIVLCTDADHAAVYIISSGVVQQVLHQLPELALIAAYCKALTGHING